MIDKPTDSQRAATEYVELPLPRIVTLIYPQRDNDVLLLRRKKWPFIGQWVGPGGKLEVLESPRAGAERELLEETGLRPGHTELRAIVTETSQRADWQWLIFVYRMRDPLGQLLDEQPEGELRWYPIDALDTVTMPAADRQFIPYVLSEQSGVREYHFDYDRNLELNGTGSVDG